MGNRLLFAACFVAGAYLANSAAVSFIKKCKSDDSKCVKQSTQQAIPTFVKGHPELGIQALEPLFYEHIDASSKDLKLILNDVTITGLKDCVAKKVQRAPADHKLFVKLMCNIKLDGSYEMDGRLLVLPIQGKGELHAILRKVVVDVEADLVDKIGKDGKNHWDVKSWKYTYELMDKAELDLQNLFPGNEVLGRAARDLLKMSSNEVVAEVGPPIMKALLTKIIKTVDSFFGKVASEDLSVN